MQADGVESVTPTMFGDGVSFAEVDETYGNSTVTAWGRLNVVRFSAFGPK